MFILVLSNHSHSHGRLFLYNFFNLYFLILLLLLLLLLLCLLALLSPISLLPLPTNHINQILTLHLPLPHLLQKRFRISRWFHLQLPSYRQHTLSFPFPLPRSLPHPYSLPLILHLLILLPLSLSLPLPLSPNKILLTILHQFLRNPLISTHIPIKIHHKWKFHTVVYLHSHLSLIIIIKSL